LFLGRATLAKNCALSRAHPQTRVHWKPARALSNGSRETSGRHPTPSRPPWGCFFPHRGQPAAGNMCGCRVTLLSPTPTRSLRRWPSTNGVSASPPASPLFLRALHCHLTSGGRWPNFPRQRLDHLAELLVQDRKGRRIAFPGRPFSLRCARAAGLRHGARFR
jgi:hypothetical protein